MQAETIEGTKRIPSLSPMRQAPGKVLLSRHEKNKRSD